MTGLVRGRETYLRVTPDLLFWGGCAAALAGFVINVMWTSVPWAVSGLLGGMALVVASLAWAVKRLARWSMSTSVGGVWLLALIYFAGPASFGAVVLLAVAALALGSLFVPASWPARGALSILAGLALISGVIGWLLPFPVHSRVAYVIVLLALVVLRWRAVTEVLRQMPAAWRTVVSEAPISSWLMAVAVGIVTTCAWLPTIHFDDLAYHLGLPSQLANLGYYKMDAASNLWAMSAWAADVLQGVTWLVAGHESRGMLDVLWLVVGLVLIWHLCEALDLPPWLRCVAVALYASLPLTAGTLTGMQTEGPTAALAAGIAVLIQHSPKPGGRKLKVFALLFGLLLALKLSNLMIAGPLGLWLLCRWRARLPWRALPISLLLLLLIAGSSYIYCWIWTGNPVLPLFNAIFHSPYYDPTNFHDHHWNAGLRWNIVWNLVFHTSRYFEGSDGTAGFVLIALGGSLLAALLDSRARPLALVALGSFLLPLTQLQYLRYPHPALALMVPAMLCGIPVATAGSRRAYGIAGVLIVLIIANLAFVPTGDWQLRSGELGRFLTTPRQDFLERYAPIDRIIQIVDRRYGPHARVLIASDAVPYGAGFAGKAYVINWYDHKLAAESQQADKDASGKGWVRLLDEIGANLVLLHTGNVSTALSAALATERGHLVSQTNGLSLWEIRHRAIAGTPTAGPPGTVTLKFDVSTLPSQPTFAKAGLLLSCKPRGAQIALAWTIGRRSAEPWSYSEWEYCLPDGTSRANLDVDVPQSITDFKVSARPVGSTRVELGLISSQLEVRPDFGWQRDIARHMRQGIPSALADWVNPWAQKGVVRNGSPTALSSTHGVVVAFNVTEALPQAALVHATLDLACDYSPAPIVIGWTMTEEGKAPKSNYAWAMCGRDGLAHASFDADAMRRVTSLTATAVPPRGTELRLLSAKSGLISDSGLKGTINRTRIETADWLTPVPDLSRAEP